MGHEPRSAYRTLPAQAKLPCALQHNSIAVFPLFYTHAKVHIGSACSNTAHTVQYGQDA